MLSYCALHFLAFLQQTSELLGKVDEGDSRDDDELSGKNLIRLLQVEVNGQLKGNE